jgi:hypothetical protein
MMKVKEDGGMAHSPGLPDLVVASHSPVPAGEPQQRIGGRSLGRGVMGGRWGVGGVIDFLASSLVA